MTNNWSQEKYIEAYRFAAEKHNGQIFPGTDWPYLVHLNLVSMEILASLNFEPDVNGDLAVLSAILHDILEDTDTSYNELKSKFGREISNGVLSLTKDKSVEKQNQMNDSLRRIKNQPKEIWMVKLADRITNLQQPPAYWDNNKKINYLKQAQLIYDELNDASEYLSKRLKNKIQHYQVYIDNQ